ncbi:hypothetical protein MPDQ_007121 [Monascus purpureus]|uniref:Uncharacterized protein n=1 Tax=Monascus purpureus TaxID=5098 RepID=A0A507R2T6_MONPU|nr:hypothetical protein MPDQ_007121 [Monascus purpureus]
MNPTVEDVQDESEIKTYPRPTPDRSHSWHEILSRHESVLSAHMEMLEFAQRDVCADGDALRIVASMVERTEELMGQFKTITSQFNANALKGVYSATMRDVKIYDERLGDMRPGSISEKNRNNVNDNASNNMSSSSIPAVRDARQPSSTQPPRQSNGRKKRSREENESPLPDLLRAGSPPSQKRKRIDFAAPRLKEEDAKTAAAVEASPETEDISAEVQRRLKIKEERRKKRNIPKSEKRKRESLLSNASFSEGTSKPERKKVKTKNSRLAQDPFTHPGALSTRAAAALGTVGVNHAADDACPSNVKMEASESAAMPDNLARSPSLAARIPTKIPFPLRDSSLQTGFPGKEVSAIIIRGISLILDVVITSEAPEMGMLLWQKPLTSKRQEKEIDMPIHSAPAYKEKAEVLAWGIFSMHDLAEMILQCVHDAKKGINADNDVEMADAPLF